MARVARRGAPAPAEADARRLLAAVAGGDEHALRDLYALYSAAVYRFAHTRLDNAADAADVLNEVMLEVWRGASRFRGESAVRTWILGITHNKTAERLRRRARDGRAAEEGAPEPIEGGGAHDPEPPPGEAVVAAAENARYIARCLETLSPELRHTMYLAFYEDRSAREIAQILGCPEGTVKSRVFTAKRALRRCLERLVEPSADNGS